MASTPVVPSGRVLWLMRALALTGLAIAGFLVYTHAAINWAGSAGAAPLCGKVSWLDCTSVLGSRWSTWLGVPVAALGGAAHLGMLVVLWRVGRSPDRTTWAVGLALAVALLGAAGWFVYLQGVRIGTWCGWCMVEHVAGGMLALLMLVYAIAGAGRAAGAAAIAGAVAVAALAIGQSLDTPAYTHRVTWRTEGERWIDTDEPNRGCVVLDGRVVLDREAYPIVGNDDAARLLVDVLDYTCTRCGKLAARLRDASGTLGDDVAVLAVIVPLDADCNPMLASTGEHYRHACELARLALAVWLADPAAFDGYHHWLLEQQASMTPDRAHEHARGLVGAPALRAALADPAIDRMIERNVRLAAHAGVRQLPGLIIGDYRLSVIPDSVTTLVDVIRDAWTDGNDPDSPDR